MSKPAFRAQTVDIACLPLRQDLLTKNVLMTAQRDFRLGNSPFGIDWLEPRYQDSFSADCCQDKTLVSCWYFLVPGSFIISFAWVSWIWWFSLKILILLVESIIDGLVKSRILPFIWIPAYAGMTIKHLISIRHPYPGLWRYPDRSLYQLDFCEGSS